LGRFTEAEEYLAKSLEGDSDPWVATNRRTIKVLIEDEKTKIRRLELSGVHSKHTLRSMVAKVGNFL